MKFCAVHRIAIADGDPVCPHCAEGGRFREGRIGVWKKVGVLSPVEREALSDLKNETSKLLENKESVIAGYYEPQPEDTSQGKRDLSRFARNTRTVTSGLMDTFSGNESYSDATALPSEESGEHAVNYDALGYTAPVPLLPSVSVPNAPKAQKGLEGISPDLLRFLEREDLPDELGHPTPGN